MKPLPDRLESLVATLESLDRSDRIEMLIEAARTNSSRYHRGSPSGLIPQSTAFQAVNPRPTSGQKPALRAR